MEKEIRRTDQRLVTRSCKNDGDKTRTSVRSAEYLMRTYQVQEKGITYTSEGLK